jgi:hypothetical protein
MPCQTSQFAPYLIYGPPHGLSIQQKISRYYVAKDGRRMPGVVTLPQESETQSKPSYFRGHCWGALGLLIGSLQAPFCLPLSLRLQQGFAHLGAQEVPERALPLAERPVAMALAFARKHARPSLLILEAFFAVAPVFQRAASLWSMQHRAPWVTLMVRATHNYVASFEAQTPQTKQRGRPRQYGEQVTLREVFDHPELFTTVSCRRYGKIEEVAIMAAHLLWKPTGGVLRFVFAQTHRGPIVLMCSDVAQDPIEALELYGCRVRIEVMFAILKHLLVAFCYRFWSKRLPRHSRAPKSNDTLQAPVATDVNMVKRGWQAYERFVMLGAIAQGLLQLVALQYAESIWEQFEAFLRTRSRELPSEATVRHVVARLLLEDFRGLKPSAMMQEMHRLCHTPNDHDETGAMAVKQQPRAA